jgi:hypothetical protein
MKMFLIASVALATLALALSNANALDKDGQLTPLDSAANELDQRTLTDCEYCKMFANMCNIVSGSTLCICRFLS